jgi:hypothetical protein
MSVKDPYAARRKKTNPEENTEERSASNPGSRQPDIPKTKKIRMNKVE